MQRLWVPGPLPGMNEILEARMLEGMRRKAGNRGWTDGTYSEMKRAWAQKVHNAALVARMGEIRGDCFSYLVLEPDRRRDPSNICFGAQKIIEDALQTCKLLENDGWKHVKAFSHQWGVDKKHPGTHVFIGDVILDTNGAAERTRRATE